MKKSNISLSNKSLKELEKEAQLLREEITKLNLEHVVNPPKNTNILRERKKKLAILLTLITNKKLVEK